MHRTLKHFQYMKNTETATRHHTDYQLEAVHSFNIRPWHSPYNDATLCKIGFLVELMIRKQTLHENQYGVRNEDDGTQSDSGLWAGQHPTGHIAVTKELRDSKYKMKGFSLDLQVLLFSKGYSLLRHKYLWHQWNETVKSFFWRRGAMRKITELRECHQLKKLGIVSIKHSHLFCFILFHFYLTNLKKRKSRRDYF